MAVPFQQLVALTYDEVQAQRNETADQWSDSSFLMALERLGGLKRVAGGATLQLPLDYRANSAADFLATDVTATGVAKTDIATAASYTFVPFVVPTNWTLYDEALNSESNQKLDLVQTIVDNALRTHDQAYENAMFAPTGGTDGQNTLIDIYPEDGIGPAVGSIAAGTETWWKSGFVDYTSGAALIADLTKLWNTVSKGSSGRNPNIVVCSANSAGILEGKVVAQQRYGKADTTGRIGFLALQFKSADVVFSKAYAGDGYFMFNTEDTKLYVVRSAWRQRRTPIEHIDKAMMNMKVFSVGQLATSNRSRGGVAFSSTIP